eukprot:g2226.t1
MKLSDDEELSFDDVFGQEDVDLLSTDSRNDVREEVSKQSETTTPVSALTLKFEGMQIDSQQVTKWTPLNLNRETSPRFMGGSSAPVWIPDSRSDWNEVSHRLCRIQEVEEQSEFIPPHLTVERPLIQFSLNSEIGRKRALFRAREKFMTMLGVNECCDVTFRETHDYQ